MDTLLHDIRYGLRTLARNRGVTLAAILCLALGIGVNTSVFTVVYGVLLRPLPFDDGDRIVTVWAENREQGERHGNLTYPDLEAYAASGAFDALAGYSSRNFALTDGEKSERVAGSSITPNLFDVLGVQPAIGRTFAPSEAAAIGFEQVVILSDVLWKRRFGADPAIIGRSVRVNDRALTVVGVMPEGFQFPARDELWMPLGRPIDANADGARYLWGLGRMRGNTSLDYAQSRLDPVSSDLAVARASSHAGWTVRAVPYRDSVVDADGRIMLWTCLGAVAFVLLIACANVANLLMARSADRQREMAVRLAMGASRARILRQLLTESVMLSLAGAGLGALIAVWLTDRTVQAIPEEMAYWIRFDFDWQVLLFTFGIAILTGLLFGLLPALQATTGDMHAELKDGSRGTGDSAPRTRVRATLVVAEIALSLVLLVGAALMIQSFMRVQNANGGFETDRMLSMRFTMSGDGFDDPRARAETISRIADAVRNVPGVQAAGVTTSIPMDDGGVVTRALVDAPSATAEQMEQGRNVSMIGVSAGMFDGLNVPIESGRDFTAAEIADSAAHVAIIARTAAATLFPNGAIGEHILLGDDATMFTVVGVVPDVQYEELLEQTEESRLQVYVPYAQTPWRTMGLMARAESDPAAVTQAVLAAIHGVSSLVTPFEVHTMQERKDITQWPSRVFGGLFATFGAIALVLALTGIYGTMSYTVSRQRREIGIRLAVGAAPLDVMHRVLAQAGRMSIIGIAIGATASVFISRLLSGLLFDVNPNDLRTFVAVPVLLAATAMLASYIPARRASRVHPIEALRSD